jgi:NUDIX domain
MSHRSFAAMVTGVTGRSVLPPDQYVASLARKRMAATAFFRDGEGRVLLVNPVYKETWDLPGGAVEAEESPHAACRREVGGTAIPAPHNRHLGEAGAKPRVRSG